MAIAIFWSCLVTLSRIHQMRSTELKTRETSDVEEEAFFPKRGFQMCSHKFYRFQGDYPELSTFKTVGKAGFSKSQIL